MHSDWTRISSRPPCIIRRLQKYLIQLVELFQENCIALIHGDFSPKNILIGSNGPIVLDAECANFGDPAFDAAFCLNHLCLKALWAPEHADVFQASTEAFLTTYTDGVMPTAIITRIADYLPGLMLARIDGKSPVEYLDNERDISMVRDFASKHLGGGPHHPHVVIADWFAAISQHTDHTMPEQS